VEPEGDGRAQQPDLEIVRKAPDTVDDLEDKWRKGAESIRKGGAGSLPGDLLAELGKLVGENKIDWKGKLDDFISAIATKSKYKLPNKRFLGAGKALWKSTKDKSTFDNLIIIADTSGSISDAELKQFMEETLSIVSEYEPEETYLLFCDTSVYTPVPILRSSEDAWEIHKAPGRGGTDFRPPFAYIEKELGDVEIGPVIFFTDGYPTVGGPNNGWPDVSDYNISEYADNVLWVIVSQHVANEQIKVPFGQKLDLVL
jgi:hypothetical protein